MPLQRDAVLVVGTERYEHEHEADRPHTAQHQPEVLAREQEFDARLEHKKAIVERHSNR